MREADTGVVDGGDEAVDVVVGGDRGVERPPEFDGAEAGAGCGSGPVEEGEIREEDGAVDGEAVAVHGSIICHALELQPRWADLPRS